MHRTGRGRPRDRKTSRALLGATVVAALVALSAGTASASVGRGVGNANPTAIEACVALVEGTVPASSGPNRNAVSDASKSCATACGTLAIAGAKNGRQSKVVTDEALLACAAACDFIVFFGSSATPGKKSAVKDPVQAAVDACVLLAAANPDGTAGLPLIENGGRSWR